MNKIKRISNMLCIFIGICIFLLSYAHASLNKELSITGEAVVRADSDIRIINSERDVVENGAYEVYNNKYSVNTTIHFFNLPNCDSTITYKVTIQNNTNETYKLKDIITLNTTNDNIEYIVNNEETPDNRILKNTTINILITFKYKECLDTKDDINITLNYILIKERGYLKANTKNISATSKFLETDLINNQINTISFVGYKDIPEDALGSYDVTDLKKLNDGDNVNLWYYEADTSTDTTLYDVYIGTSEEVYITNGYSLFGNLSNLKQINFKDETGINRFNTTEATNMSAMFSNTKALTSLDLSSFDTSKATDMTYMLGGCTNLKTIYASDNFVTTKVTSSGAMFLYSSNIVGGEGTTYNASYLDKTYARVDGGVDNPGYFTKKSN